MVDILTVWVLAKLTANLVSVRSTSTYSRSRDLLLIMNISTYLLRIITIFVANSHWLLKSSI